MTLEFLCPNGHKITCPDEHAGRLAKCPRCGVAFRIPAAAVAATVGAVKAGDSAVGRSLPTAERTAPAEGVRSGELPPENGNPATEETIEFLCPQGHRLSGPARMQGHAGQCPHCGAKFQIPFAEPSPERNDPEVIEVEWDEDEAHGGIEQPSDLEADRSTKTFRSTEEVQQSEFEEEIDPGAPYIARLFSRLWRERDHGGTVEVHLAGGAIIVPQWFERQLSRETHALFGTQAADGSVTLTAIPWESVARVIVRGVQGLPEGMFE